MNLIEIQTEAGDVKISGFLGKPVISRGNRNFEKLFSSMARYVKNQIVSKAIEDAYKDFTMQHKYPFVALQITMPGEEVDVNVHPAKLEIRFQNQQAVYNAVYEAVDRGLRKEELIPQVKLEEPKGNPQSRCTISRASANAQRKRQNHRRLLQKRSGTWTTSCRK